MSQSKSEISTTQYQLPEWESTVTRPRSPTLGQRWQEIKPVFTRSMNAIFPPQRRYFGQSRKVFFTIIFAFLLALMALTLGLAVGLTVGSSHQYNSLPLGSQSYTGDLTYFDPALGACGKLSSEIDDIVSISHSTFDAVSKGSNPNANPLCGHTVRAVREGRSVDLGVVDRCVGCQPTDIDVSLGAFKKLADPASGRIRVTWAWLSPVPTP